MHRTPQLLKFTFLLALPLLLAACGGQNGEETAADSQPAQLVFYNWPEDAIANVFDDFTAETGIEIVYLTYESQEEAIANMAAGELYDVVVMENQYVPGLISGGLIAEIDYTNVPNARNITPSFRDLKHDPGSRHTIPYSWGTTGLVVRTDLVEEPVTSWAVLWDPRYAGMLANWDATPRYTLGAALQALGYSINSENPQELEEALDQLRTLQQDTIWLNDEASSAPLLVSGEAAIALGWSLDYWLAAEEVDTIAYVLPEEGTLLWGDNFVIPANSPNKAAAELLLDFILRPEISAQIINENYYPMANEAAKPFVDPALLADPVVYPPNDVLRNAEFILPLSAEGQALWDDVWARFTGDA